MDDLSSTPRDVTRTTLAVLFIGVLIAATLWIVLPFLTSFIWATMIVVATWPVLLTLEKRCRGRRWAAVAVMTAGLLLVFFLPLSAAIGVAIGRGDEMVAWAKNLPPFSVPPPPAWLQHLPLAGPKLASRWQQLSAVGPEELSRQLGPYAKEVAGWFLTQAGSAGKMLVRFFLTVIIAAVLYAKGEAAAAGALSFFSRLAGEQGRDAAILAARSVRAVALGVLLTGLIQAGAGGLGLALVGVPGAVLLTGVMIVLCFAQLGPALVMFPAVFWVYWSGDPVRGTILLAWAIFVSTFDNFLRPVLIRMGADLPMVLIFPGVIGGLFAFGILGLFLGPIVLVVTYTLLAAWVRGEAKGLPAATRRKKPPSGKKA